MNSRPHQNLKRVDAISVCLASFNGGEHIKDQVKSILSQFSLPHDELIICDDVSSDNTLSELASLDDDRIKIVKNTVNIGYIRNFENAIKLANNEYLFFSDQDDLWATDRVSTMIYASKNSGRNVVVANFNIFETGGELYKNNSSVTASENISGIRNILKFMTLSRIPYFGSCMMVKKGSLDYLLPFKDDKLSHDVWISIAANIRNDIFHLDTIVTHRRVHIGNLTNDNRTYLAKFRTRLLWTRTIISEFARARLY